MACVRTEFVPTYEVLLTDSNPDIDVRRLGMQTLAEATPEQIVEWLRELVDAYGRWIDEREVEIEELRDGLYGSTEYLELACKQMRLCRIAQKRMMAGIRLLERDERAMEAFRTANKAMARQLGRSLWIRDGRKGQPQPQGTWRPFQIGFLLLCLNGIVDPSTRTATSWICCGSPPAVARPRPTSA